MAHRVVVWGTGNVGIPALRIVAASPELELVGVLVSNPAKVGRDAGALAGLEPLGIEATDDVDAILDLRPDAVAYCASGDFRPAEALDDVEKALRAGANVVSTSIYPLYDPTSAPVALRERMTAACREGGTSCFVSGIDPGFINDVIPLALSGLCEEIREIRAFEIFNYAYYDQPEAVRTLIGFGEPMSQTPPMILPGVPTMIWGGVIRLLARGLGLEIDEVDEVVERRPLEKTVENRLGVFEAGTQGAFRFEVRALVDGVPKIVVDHTTRIDDSMAPDWPHAREGSSAHGVRITGRPNIHLEIESEDDAGDRAAGGNTTAVARVIHAIPRVCAAEPGLLDALDIPLIWGRGLVR